MPLGDDGGRLEQDVVPCWNSLAATPEVVLSAQANSLEIEWLTPPGKIKLGKVYAVHFQIRS
jgi:hypothetical protein